MKLFLIPAEETNIEETITKKVDISVIEKEGLLMEYQISALKNKLKEDLGKEKFNCWALTKNSQFLFESMNLGDIALFAINRTKAFKFIGEIFHKESFGAELGNFLWGYNPNKAPWTHVYFVKNIVEIKEISKQQLLSDLGYTDPKDRLQGAREINRAVFDRLLKSGEYPQINEYVEMIMRSRK